MPSSSAVGVMAADSRDRLRAAAERIAAATGVQLPEIQRKRAASPEHSAALQIQQFAAWAEALADKVAPRQDEPTAPEQNEGAPPPPSSPGAAALVDSGPAKDTAPASKDAKPAPSDADAPNGDGKAEAPERAADGPKGQPAAPEAPVAATAHPRRDSTTHRRKHS